MAASTNPHSSGSWIAGAATSASGAEVGVALAVVAGLGAALVAPGLLPVIGGLVVAKVVSEMIESRRAATAEARPAELVSPAFHAVLPPKEAFDVEKLAARRREQARMLASAQPEVVRTPAAR